MRIRKLEIQGFKSFAERTAFHFGAGISGVVGSNGCGKSNVVDAVKWCLGEQSAKSLRGSQMGDVIFNGTQQRSAASLAEVSLTFVAEGIPFPGEFARYEEVQVTRRLFRNGNSEYLINQQRARLRDIQDIFLDTGVNNRMYSFIEQGRIGQIVNARPENRRALFEEAAGISRYKARRDDALVKLRETEANLERASDLVDDLQRRMRSLARQVERAGRYRRLQSRIRQGEIYLGLARFAALADDKSILDEEQQEAIAREGHLDRNQKEQEAALVAQRAALRLLEEGVGRQRDELSELEATRREQESARQYQSREHDTLTNRLSLIEPQLEEQRTLQTNAAQELEQTRTERVAVESRSGSINVDVNKARSASNVLEQTIRERLAMIDRLKNEQLNLVSRISGHRAAMESSSERRFDLEQRRQRLLERQAQAGGQNEELAAQMTALDERLAAARTQGDDLQAAVSRARELVGLRERARKDLHRQQQASEKALRLAEREEARQKTRLESLQQLQNAHEGLEDDVRSALSIAGVHGTLAEHLDVPQALEVQLAAALGPALDAILADNDAVALAAAAAVKGQATVFSLTGCVPVSTGLAGLVGGTDIGRRALGGLLGECAQATSLEKALEMHRQTGGQVVVTDGSHAVVRRNGQIVVGEPRTTGTVILARRREITALTAACSEAEAQTARMRSTLEMHIVAHQQSEEELQRARKGVEEARAQSAEGAMALRQVEQERTALTREIQRQSSESRTLANELRELDQAMRAHDDTMRMREDAITEDMERQEDVEEELSENQSLLVDERESATAARQRLETLTVEAGGLRERLLGLRRAETAAENVATNAARQIQALTKEQTDSTARIEALVVDDARLRVLLQEIGERQGSLHTALDLSRRKVRTEREALTERERALKATRTALDAAREERVEIDQQRSALAHEMARLKETMHEKHSQEVTVLLQRVLRDGHVTLPADPSVRTNELPDAAPLPERELVYLEDLRVTEELIADEDSIHMWMDFLETDREALARLGEVNLIAVQEYTEVGERYTLLCGQRDDLETSMRTIQQAIAKLNRTCRERFRETFDTVNKHFQEIYPRLVGGGGARLSLTDEEDLLETGVEIYAQPPGKKLQSLSLLSGGETAMVAIALIFSLFRVKPSPFCLLDEVDAPLDEGNGARFNRMLQEMAEKSQFIVITHNKKTMECADTLYGVTMDPPGISTIVSVNLD